MDMNPVVKNDIQELIDQGQLFAPFQGKTILITGATGLVGSLLTKTLLLWNAQKQGNIRVLALVRDPQKAVSVFADCPAQPELIQCDLCRDSLQTDAPVDYVVHTAAVTASRTMVTQPVDTIRTALEGTDKIMSLAVQKKVAGMVYLSSMEAYGRLSQDTMATEKDLGTVDLTSVRSCYPESKRMCECMCTAYATQYGLRVCTARLAQTFGAGILPTENRVFAQFARSVLRGEDIVLHTAGRSEGNYVYTTDAISAILLLLQKGEAGQIYNVSNEENHMTVARMAQLVADAYGQGKSRVIFDIPADAAALGYAPDTKLHLSAAKLRVLGWCPRIGLREAYGRLLNSLQQEG